MELIWLVILCLGSVLARDVHFYVDPKGLDTNSGLGIHLPLKTIAKAVRLASGSTYKGANLFIELLPGYHDLHSTVNIGHHHGNMLTIRSYNKQEVHVTGGRRISPASFQPVNDHGIINALPNGAFHYVKVVDLPSLNITDFGTMKANAAYHTRSAPLEVFFNGKPLRIARWPNEGFINIVGVPGGTNGNKIRYSSDRPKNWAYTDDLWVYGYFYWSWSDSSSRVTSLDAQHMVVNLDSKTLPAYGLKVGHWGAANLPGFRDQGGYFRFINVLSELDVPGEYYLDRSTGNLYVWMPSSDGRIKSSDVIYVSMVKNCFRIASGVQNVAFSNFILEACRERGILAYDVKNIHVTNMEVKNTGDYGVLLGGDSRSCYISKSIFHNGDGAISISGGNRVLLESGGNIVEDCEIYRFAREVGVGRNAVRLGGVGNLVRYNHIHIGQYTAIRFSGNDHVIEYNHIHHTCMNASDCGAIHTGRDWTYRGNKVRYNLVHDTLRLVPGADVRGVMLDDQVSSVTITNNVFYDNEIHVNIGGGRDNIVNRNIMYNSTKASMQVDGRGLARFDYASDIVKHLHAMPYKDQLWASRYPILARIDSQNKSLPEGNQIHENLVFNTAHKPFIIGMSGWLKSNKYFNVTDNEFSYGPTDHFNVNAGDLRVKCHASTWANHVNFQQVVTPNDVGPRYDLGPTSNTIVHKTVPIHESSSVCTTKAPATNIPMSAYLPDGSGQTALFHVSNQGCWFHVEKCTNVPAAVGTYRDTYGEKHENAGTNETACFHRAVEQWHYCGSKPNEAVASIFGPTGATTFAGDGCYMASYGCPKHMGPADGHVVQGKLFRDTWAEQHNNAAKDEAKCLARALTQWTWCGSHPNHPVTSLYRPTGVSVTAGAGCWIKILKCPKRPDLEPMFYDAEGATNSNSDDSEGACLARAADYWRLCGEDSQYPVTAYYRPTASHSTYPTKT